MLGYLFLKHIFDKMKSVYNLDDYRSRVLIKFEICIGLVLHQFRDYFVVFQDSLGTKLKYFNSLGTTNSHLTEKLTEGLN
jgi:hypothetical protein